MAHLINEEDATYSTISNEWHGKARLIDEINEQTIASIIDTPIIEKPMFVADFDEQGAIIPGSLVHVDGYKTVMADLSNRTDLPEHVRRMTPLHTPKDSYRIISNREIFECVKKAIQDVDGVRIITAGTLDSCRKFYLSVELNKGESMKTERGDAFQAILNFLSSHDGTLNLTAMDSFTRTVCMNTFRYNLAYEGGAFKAYVPHTKNAGVQIDSMAEYLNCVLLGRQKVMQSMSYLETLAMESPKQAAYVAAGYFTATEATEMSTNAFNRSNAIRDLSTFGKGNAGKTRADMLNGFTEYFTHFDGAGGKKASKAERWSASQFGQAADHKEKFLGLLLDESEFQQTLSRGEKLYRDKEQAILA